MMDIKKQAFFNTVGNVVYLLSLWLLTVIATQCLGYKAAGELTLAMTVGNLVILIQLYGVRGFQSSDVSFQYSPSVYFRTRLITIVAGVFLGIVSSFLIGYARDVMVTLSLYMLFRSSEAFSDVMFGDDQRMGKLEFAGYSLFLRGIITGVLFFFGSYYFNSLHISLLFISVGGLILTVLLDFPLYWRTVKQYIRIDYGCVCDVLKDCFPLLVTTLIPAIIFAVPRVVLERWYGAELLGFYGNLSTPAMLIITLVPNILMAILPRYGRMVVSGDFRAISKLWLQSLLGTLFLLGICLLGAFFFGRPVLAYFYTKQILPYFHFLYYVLIAMGIYAIEICCATVLVAMRQKFALTVAALWSVVICLVTSIPFVKNFGISGAIAVLVASYTMQVIFQCFYIMRVLIKTNNN